MSAPQTPTTAQISANIVAQLEASLNQTIPLLPKAFNRVLANTLAAVFVVLFKYGGFIFLQQFVATASGKDTTIFGVVVNPLKFWGRLIGIGDPTEATNAVLLIDVTVTNQTGFLDSNSQLVGSTNGVTYITLSSVALSAATVQVQVQAVSDQNGGGGAGTIGNLEAGQVLTFANPLANVAREATVNSQVVTAADAEDTEVYRQRIIDRFQKLPQGGAYADYEGWGEEVEGILNVYPYTGQPGEVDVYVEATAASSGNPDGIPTTAQLEAVLDNINYNQNLGGLADRRNANAFVNALAITRSGFDIEVNGISGVDDLAQVQTDIEDGLATYFAAAEPYIPGLTIPPRTDQITRTRISSIVEDVVTAAGGTFTNASFFVSGSAISLTTYILDQGEKAKLVNVTFIA